MFFKTVASEKSLPDFSWNLQKGNPSWRLSLSSKTPIYEIKLWKATSRTLDFRQARWNSQQLQHSGGEITGKVALPPNGDHVAMFAEVTFLDGNRPYSLTTLVYKK